MAEPADKIGPVHLPTELAGALARRYLAARRRRPALLAPGLFLDPAWDMLLDLFVNAAEGRRISISSACLASGVPTSTALDWLRKLEYAQLVQREPDSRDARRTFLRLNPDVIGAIEQWLQSAFHVG